MELRQLEAFVVLASELHFGRAARRLHLGQPGLSDLIRRLEREVGTPLLRRSTRRVHLTSAGVELLRRATAILDEAAATAVAMHHWADGDVGLVRIGVTPPVHSDLVPHLCAALHAVAPGVELQVRRMWYADLDRAVTDGFIDVAITCGPLSPRHGLASDTVCGAAWLVGLRAGHRLAGQPAVDLADLARETLGVLSEVLFPGWVAAQHAVLRSAKIAPPIVELTDTDLSAGKWLDQPNVDWILTTASAARPDDGLLLRPLTPARLIPIMLHWFPRRARNAAVGRFVRMSISAELPAGLVHIRHQALAFKAG
ncbi:MAG: LysR family transcriptional regulator [Actinomycetota bacterium]